MSRCSDDHAAPESTPLFAGVTDAPALSPIPGFEKILETEQRKNPSRRLTQPEDFGAHHRAAAVLGVYGGKNVVG